jgi:hypothetical protein
MPRIRLDRLAGTPCDSPVYTNENWATCSSNAVTAKCSQARPRGRAGRTTATTAPIATSAITNRHSITVGTCMCPVAIFPTMKPDDHSGTNNALSTGTTQRPVGAAEPVARRSRSMTASATHC